MDTDRSIRLPRGDPPDGTSAAEERHLAQRLALAHDVAGLESWEVDLATGEVTWSHRIPELFGFPKGARVSVEDLEAAIHPDDHPHSLEFRKALLRDGTPFAYDVRILHPDGEERILHVRTAVPRDEEGRATRAIGITQDVTELRRRGVESEQWRARLSLAHEVAQMSSWELDPETGETTWHHRLLSIPTDGETGTTHVDLRRWIELVHPDDRQQVRVAFGRLAESDGPLELTYRIESSDGPRRAQRVRARVLEGPDGRRRIIGTTRDVTEEYDAEERLRASEERLRQLLEAAETGYVLADRDDILLVNGAFLRILGYEREEFLALKPRLQFIAPDDHPSALRELRAVFTQQNSEYHAERRFVRKDGSIAIVDAWARLFESEQPGPVILFEMTDVTEHVQAQRALQASESRLRAVLDAVAEGIVTVRPDGSIASFNRAAERIFRHHVDAVVGKPVALLLAGEGAAGRAEASAPFEPGTHELLGRRADGSLFPMLVTCGAVTGPEEPLLTAVVRDVSRERRAAADLEGLHEALQERSEERRVLLRRLLEGDEETRRRLAFDIHDGPAQQLTGADMFLEAFRHERTTIEQPKVELHLDRAKEHLQAALVDARRIMSDLRPALLDDFGLEEALRTSFAETEQRTGCEIEFVAATGRRRLRAAVEISLFRIAQEAVSNAMRHSGSRRIRVVLHGGEAGTILTVRDWGRGIRAVSGRHRGLGLISMRERAELFGGSFAIDSSPGRGTTISVRLPRSLVAAVHDAPEDATELGTARA